MYKQRKDIGIVVIGRNEGERLKKCFESISIPYANVVYVDSGSKDGSVALAQSIGVNVVLLDSSIPFSAGRARNEGFDKIVECNPDLQFVQFVDGDCLLVEEWLSVALKFLSENQAYAVVAGRRREMFPESSVYNKLCDIEWNTPVGDTLSCGGDFVVRVNAFRDTKGFNPVVIAGEEPELCYRLRLGGWKIYRIDHDMTFHDAAITTFKQWWKRSVRTGHAYAQGFWLHGRRKPYYNLKNCLRVWFWALGVPIIVILSVVAIGTPAFFFLGIYFLSFKKIYTKKKKENEQLSIVDARKYALFIILCRWAELVGQCLFFNKLIFNQKFKIVEYK